LLSLLSWERGLKSQVKYMLMNCPKSLLSWERGLKYLIVFVLLVMHEVAPLVGAWIEISANSGIRCLLMSLLSWERGLKYSSLLLFVLCFRRSSRGSVD